MAIAKKKKRFWDVEIPLIRKTTHLYAFDKGALEGRLIKYDLTRILRGKGLLLDARVTVENDVAIATPIKATLLPFYIRRMIRKRTRYVEDSFTVESRDAMLTIKPFLITRRRVSRAVRKALREKTAEELKEYIAIKRKDQVFDEVLKNILQKQLSAKLKKIYPLSLCEIRILAVKKEKELSEEEKKTLAAEVAAEEKEREEKKKEREAERDEKKEDAPEKEKAEEKE